MPLVAHKFIQTSSPTTIPPNLSLHIIAVGVGSITLKFASSIPSSLSQFAVSGSNNMVTIPVYGKLILDVKGVISVIPNNVVLSITQHLQTLSEVIPQAQFNANVVDNVSISVNNNTVSSVLHDNVPIPIPNTLVYFVASKKIQFVGYGVTFTVSDYDPINKVPAGNPLTIQLNGTQTNFAEAPSNDGIYKTESYTGYIIISNISGTGQMNLFLS